MSTTPPILFDRTRLRKRRARAAADFPGHDFMLREAAIRAEEALQLIARAFPTMIELGAHTGQLGTFIANRPGTLRYIHCDHSEKMLQQISGLRVAVDEEFLPFADNSADAIISLLSLHWVNDLPGTLAQIHRALKPDGLFLAILPGGETLRELRSIFAATESTRNGGLSPRVAPFIDVRDAGALLQRAGFALPVADSETITVTYENLFALMDDLRGSAQSNMLQQQVQHFTPRGFFIDAAKRYADMFADAENRIKATMEFITLTAWKPDASQQQPARRGSGKVSLSTVLN